jgi:asparagine synthase (glutamine-hydrolysing)
MELRRLLTSAVDKRIRSCSTTWGVFLSGGLDSSIVAALATRHGKIRTYSIGLQDSPDLAAAREVAAFLGSDHTEVVFTIAEGLRAIPDAIRAVETCDITTVRASVPMYLLAQRVQQDGIRVMLSGEGADELFAGYAYNRFAPDPEALFQECVDKLDNLHAYDCQRANKSCAAWGIECRVPFLDHAVVDFAMNKLHPREKMWRNMEKEFLREEFLGALPDRILMRRKAQFSDAVGKKWIQACRKLFDEHTYYKTLYKAACPHEACLYELETVACSTSKGAQWLEAKRDPSGELEF